MKQTALAALVLNLTLAACTGGDGSRQAPPLSLPRVSGGAESLAAHKGKVVLVVFWATWCPTCREEMPQLQDLHARLGPKGFEVLAVNLDDDPFKAVPPFTKELKIPISFPMLAGDSAAQAAFSVRGLPALFLIDREGTIVRRYLGALDARSLENDILSQLARRPS